MVDDRENVIKLQNCNVANGTTKAVRKALIWIECLLENVSGYEGWREFFHIYELGMIVIQTIMHADLS